MVIVCAVHICSEHTLTHIPILLSKQIQNTTERKKKKIFHGYTTQQNYCEREYSVKERATSAKKIMNSLGFIEIKIMDDTIVGWIVFVVGGGW